MFSYITEECTYGKKFKSVNLNKSKYNMLYNIALYLREFRNSLSIEFWSNFEKYIVMTKTDFLKEIRANFNIKLSPLFDYDLITTVYTAYKNRTNAIIRQLTFETRTYQRMEFYKRTTKAHNKGDLKYIKFSEKKTRLTTTLTYLARYGNEDTENFIRQQIITNTSLKEDKKKFYNNLLDVFAKFSFERLFKLAMFRRNRIYDNYRKRNAIHFESLTFGARSRRKVFLSYNKNFDSMIKTFITLSWIDGNVIYVPVKYSKKFHGDMKLYNAKEKNFLYEISFDERYKEVFVHYGIPGEREVFDARACKNFIGADENLKHNMYTLSSDILDNEGNAFNYVDYDRDIIEDFIKFQKLLDSYKKAVPNYTMGKKMREKSDLLRKQIISSERRKIASMCEAIKRTGKNHIVAEELSIINLGKNYYIDEYRINYNSLMKFVHFITLPDELVRIAHKHGIAVSLVHAAYTSQMCPKCGHIHKNNRKTQEKFICEKCRYEAAADENSSLNILQRVLNDVLRVKLLKQLDNGEYRPKKMKKEKVKLALLSLQEESEL